MQAPVHAYLQGTMGTDGQGRLPSSLTDPYLTQSFSVLGTNFDCPTRYQLIRPIGQGAYGIVCSADDVLTGERVAIKKIAGVADNATDCIRTLREMRLLRHFSHENVIALKDVYIPERHRNNIQDVYTVTELMDTDLHQVISSGQLLTDEHMQYFTYQILRALKHIHAANVIHRDLKPSNILLNGNCDLKICDFGLAREVRSGFLTAYVMTRWYRAPEIMLSERSYTNAVDMWSVGCILGEMIAKQPLFPGNDYVQQLKLVTDLIGSPSEEEIETIPSDHAQRFVRNHLMNRPRKSLSELFPNAPELLRDLLNQMLVFDPRRRISVADALRHPYLESLYSLDDDPEYVDPFSFEYDGVDNLDKDTLKSAIWQEAQSYRQQNVLHFQALQQQQHQQQQQKQQQQS